MSMSNSGICPILRRRTNKPATKYKTHMKGTSFPATEPIRLIPPMMTHPTMTASKMPIANVSGLKFSVFSISDTPGISKYCVVTAATFHAWNILPPVIAESTRVKQKIPPIVAPSLPPAFLNRLSTTYMGPPCGLSGSEVSRVSIDCVTSVIFNAMPRNPITHIQKTAPGPPMATARATPAIFPRPTVADSAADNAWK